MRRVSYRALLGAILLVLGALLLLRVADVYETDRVLVYIPSLFVLLGLYALLKSGFRNLGGPVALILVFGTIQLIVLDIVSSDFLLPIAVIALGLAFLLSRYKRPSDRESGAEEVDLLAIFGGVDSRSTSRSFRGGEVSAIFGGVKLDLRDSAVQDAPAMLHVMVLFGGADLLVPENWRVKMDVLPVLGSAEDERRRAPAGADAAGERPELIVRGFVAFGGFSMKD